MPLSLSLPTNPQGLADWVSELYTGLQYVDFQFDGADGEDLVMTIRAGYRGSSSAHDANRGLFKRLKNWRALL